MKGIITLLVALCLVAFNKTVAQATIKSEAKKLTGTQFEIRITVSVEEPWHIYSMKTPDDGPFPTKVTFKKNPIVILNGSVKEEGDLIEKHEEVFDTQVKYYEGTVVFIQKITVKGKAKTNITGTIEYMLCNEEQCMPPKKESFSVQLQ